MGQPITFKDRWELAVFQGLEKITRADGRQSTLTSGFASWENQTKGSGGVDRG